MGERMVCGNCQQEFPNSVVIEDKRRNLRNRRYCLQCSPFGTHNTRKLERVSTVPGHQICTRCDALLPLNDFYGGGSYKECKGCFDERMRARETLMRERCTEYLGGACALCGYSRCLDALDFHHRDPKEKGFQISGMFNRSFKKLRPELDKCVLVCANCHREIHAGLHPDYLLE